MIASARKKVREALATYGAATARQLAEMTGEPERDVRAAIRDLCVLNVVCRRGDKNKRRASVYELTGATIEIGKPVEAGASFTGVDWSHATSRAGCLDHLKYHSRRGSALVPHTGHMVHLTRSG